MGKTNIAVVAFLLLAVLGSVQCYVCEGTINNIPIRTIRPVLNKTVPHGQKYTIDNNGELMQIINITGNAFQMGKAYGQLMSDEIHAIVNAYFHYVEEHAEEELKLITKLPKWLQPSAKKATVQVLRWILRFNGLVTRKYTTIRFQAELDGIAEGANIDRNALVEINMIPEYTKAGCSILGAWGNATINGDLLHLRALDWDTNAPLNNYPIVVVYHSNEKGSQPFANVGWAGFVGSITGFSPVVGVGEKVRKQNTNENETRLGKPWNYAIRDVMQFATNIDEALQMLNETDRTCSIYLGIGSKVNNTFRLVEYSHKEFTVYDDHNFPYTSKHGQFDHVVYMPIHDDNSECFNDLIRENYGRIDSEWIMRVLAPLHKTGDTQLAVYNYRNMELLLQYSRGGVYAYNRTPLRIDLAPFLV